MGVSVNLALNRKTAASSYVMPYAASRAVDGSQAPINRWLCNLLPAWLSVDLGAVYSINRWVVRHMPAAGWSAPSYCIGDFKLQASSDNVNWTDIDTVTGNISPLTDKTFTPVNYRYVRVYVTKGLNCNPQMASFMEFEVYPAQALLTGLTVSSGALSPAFVNTVFNYTTPNVANSVTSVAVKPTAEDPTATIKVNNVAVTSGNSTNVALNVGSNAIKVVVTSADGKTTNTYTVTVVRDAAPAAAYLTGLALSTTATPSVAVPYAPTPFNKDTTGYSASVGYDVDKIVVTPTTDISGAAITVNGVTVASGAASGPIPLIVGSNSIPVVVTNGTTTKTYTITVTRAVSAYLSGLVINNTVGAPIGLTPAFSGHTLTGYTSSVDFTTSSITIIPTPEDSAATVSVTVNGTVLTGTQPTANLNLGDNNIIIQVKARDNSVTNQYTVTVTRKHSTYLSGISAIKVGGTKLAWDNPFSKSLTNYTIKTDASKVKITYTLEDSTSTATFKINNVISATTVTVPNVVTIEVTSTSGIPSTTYTLTLVNG